MYRVRILRRATRDIRRLPSGYPRLVSARIRSLSEEPRPRDSKKLIGINEYRIRVGVYRVIYDIDDRDLVVTIYRVRHRREAYR